MARSAQRLALRPHSQGAGAPVVPLNSRSRFLVRLSAGGPARAITAEDAMHAALLYAETADEVEGGHIAVCVTERETGIAEHFRIEF